MPPLPRRLRSFSLRTLMVLVGVVCLLVAWVAKERRGVVQRQLALARITGAGVTVYPARIDQIPWIPEARLPRIRRVLGDNAILIFVFDDGDDPRAQDAALWFQEAEIKVRTPAGQIVHVLDARYPGK